MIQVTLDKAANLLTIVYEGRITPEESKRSLPETLEKVRDSAAGFRLLSDLRALEAMDLGCVPDIEQVMDACNRQGISTIVRIIPDPHKDIGLNIMSLFHYGRSVRIITCDTIEQARAALEAQP